jgi:hypothetical protein
MSLNAYSGRVKPGWLKQADLFLLGINQAMKIGNKKDLREFLKNQRDKFALMNV